MASSSSGPDLVIAGAARAGTSFMAAQFANHPEIDPGKVKEPNYYSRNLELGVEWYEGLYQARRPGLLRLDASTSYTSALYRDALDRLGAAAPEAVVVYIVRDPVARAMSHYQLRHHYFHLEPAATFGAALAASDYYVVGSDYSYWLPRLTSIFGAERVLVAPFELVTRQPEEVSTQVCQLLGIGPPPAPTQAREHRNAVVEYRGELARRAVRRFRRSRAYPLVRSTVGADRLRRARRLVTRRPQLPSPEETLASCSPAQNDELRELTERAGAAARRFLQDQDQRLGLTWATMSFAAGHPKQEGEAPAGG